MSIWQGGQRPLEPLEPPGIPLEWIWPLEKTLEPPGMESYPWKKIKKLRKNDFLKEYDFCE